MKNLIFSSIFLTLALPIYCMEDPRENKECSDNISQSNTLADGDDLLHRIYNHSWELLERIMNLLPMDDPGYNYLKLYGKFPIREEHAQVAIKHLTKKA